MPERETINPIATAPATAAAATTGHQHAAWPSRGARVALDFDARAQGFRRLHLGRCGLRERDRTLLLGEAVGKLLRRRDPFLELAATVRRQRPVRQRGQLGDLVAVCFVAWVPSQRHGTSNGSSLLEERGGFAGVNKKGITPSMTPCSRMYSLAIARNAVAGIGSAERCL